MVACSFIQAFCLAKGVTAVFDKSSCRLCWDIWQYACWHYCSGHFWYDIRKDTRKKMAAKVKAVIRNTMLVKLMQLGPSYRNDKRTGNLQSLITDGVESFEAFLVQYLPQTVVVFVTTLFSTVYLWTLDWAVGLLVLIMAILAIAVPHLFMPAVSKVMIEYWQNYADLNAQYIDSMQGMNTLKSMGVSKREGKKLAERAWGFAGESMKKSGNFPV